MHELHQQEGLLQRTEVRTGESGNRASAASDIGCTSRHQANTKGYGVCFENVGVEYASLSKTRRRPGMGTWYPRCTCTSVTMVSKVMFVRALQ